jgi:hypothetical protein
MRLAMILLMLAMAGCASPSSEFSERIQKQAAASHARFVGLRDKFNREYCGHTPDQRKDLAWREWQTERSKPGSPYSGPVSLWAELEVACREANGT